MALTHEQKAANAAARKVRDKAHGARRHEMRKALDAVESDPDVVTARQRLDAADTALEFERNTAQAQIEDIRAQIRELEKRAESLRSTPRMAELRAARDVAADEWRGIRSRKERAVEDLYPDMDGHARWSAASWTPPKDVQDEMDKAARAAGGAE